MTLSESSCSKSSQYFISVDIEELILVAIEWKRENEDTLT